MHDPKENELQHTLAHEQHRIAYLDALGIDSYISRSQLPGAAATPRLVLRRMPPPVIDQPMDIAPEHPTAGKTAPVDLPRVDTARPRASVPSPQSAEPQRSDMQQTARFSLSAITCGNLLWLEQLHDMPLAREQVQLIQAMARALAHSSDDQNDQEMGTQFAQFDWPMHQNRQLDQGNEAARAGLAAFVARRTEQHSCRGVVLLGAPCQHWATQLPELAQVRTSSTREMLDKPALKAQVWLDLQPLLAL